MTYPLVLDLAAEGIPVAVTCRVLGFSKQAFYKWKADPVTHADLERAYLTNAALDIHADDPEFGYRFIADELEDQGYAVSRNTVHSICRDAGIVAAVHRRRGSGKKAGPPVHDDHVQRDFTADAPDRVWLTDITEHWTAWIPAIVATPAARSGDAGEEVHGAAEVGVSGVDRSGRIGAGGCSGRWRESGSRLQVDEAGGAVNAAEHAARLFG